ncbi:hypothetical protein HME9302_01325 [Alteripontixanthobacter maritimus]|uniref:Uncharacterized protein n=1 Tax=Alteripontixanthobacter maritimus TaxID=2161824 RepID=A0A369QA93_9SPHN|nr:hypothetical protein HME9302_01325 [Alteripontixanthobacter maritimus]
MIVLAEEELALVSGGMRLPPYDSTKICAHGSGSLDNPPPSEPQRGDYPAGRGGDAAFRYEYAKYRHTMTTEFGATEGCFS